MIAWLQCPAGASGDMLLGALIDASSQNEPNAFAATGDWQGEAAPSPTTTTDQLLESVRSAVDALGVEPMEIDVRPVTRQGIAATKADVRPSGARAAQAGSALAGHIPPTRTWADVRALLKAADLPEPVRAHALDVFSRLARAEAAAHGTSSEAVHFHEVGALDALADVVGTCTALHALGVTELTCSPIALGTGLTRGEHGSVPVPGPAVLELLREAGAPVYTTDLPYELCTPTGAALLAGTASHWGEMPQLRIRATGAGAGTRDLPELPNVTRVVLGEPVPDARTRPTEARQLMLLETNVDDLDPRVWPDVLARLLTGGAVDAWLTPILMKKGRPAHALSVLVDVVRADAVRQMMFTETSTLGIRERLVARSVLDRTIRTVEVSGRAIAVKLAYFEGEPVNVQPEYDDVVAAAAALNRSVREVLAEAIAAARDRGEAP